MSPTGKDSFDSQFGIQNCNLNLNQASSPTEKVSQSSKCIPLENNNLTSFPFSPVEAETPLSREKLGAMAIKNWPSLSNLRSNSFSPSLLPCMTSSPSRPDSPETSTLPKIELSKLGQNSNNEAENNSGSIFRTHRRSRTVSNLETNSRDCFNLESLDSLNQNSCEKTGEVGKSNENINIVHLNKAPKKTKAARPRSMYGGLVGPNSPGSLLVSQSSEIFPSSTNTSDNTSHTRTNSTASGAHSRTTSSSSGKFPPTPYGTPNWTAPQLISSQSSGNLENSAMRKNPPHIENDLVYSRSRRNSEGLSHLAVQSLSNLAKQRGALPHPNRDPSSHDCNSNTGDYFLQPNSNNQPTSLLGLKLRESQSQPNNNNSASQRSGLEEIPSLSSSMDSSYNPNISDSSLSSSGISGIFQGSGNFPMSLGSGPNEIDSLHVKFSPTVSTPRQNTLSLNTIHSANLQSTGMGRKRSKSFSRHNPSLLLTSTPLSMTHQSSHISTDSSSHSSPRSRVLNSSQFPGLEGNEEIVNRLDLTEDGYRLNFLDNMKQNLIQELKEAKLKTDIGIKETLLSWYSSQGIKIPDDPDRNGLVYDFGNIDKVSPIEFAANQNSEDSNNDKEQQEPRAPPLIHHHSYHPDLTQGFEAHSLNTRPINIPLKNTFIKSIDDKCEVSQPNRDILARNINIGQLHSNSWPPSFFGKIKIIYFINY
jgi:hypothetical protein